MDMKKMAGLGIVLLAAGFGGTTVFAAESTTADVEFTAPTTGALIIADAPAAISFGTQEITVSGQTLNAEGLPSVEINDLRGGGDGWQLQVSSSAFENNDDSEIVLKGATISFPVGNVTPVGNNTADSPTAKEVTIDASNTSLPKNVFVAADQTGQGGWIVDWNNEAGTESEMELNVPTALVGDFTAEILWTLLDTPEA